MCWCIFAYFFVCVSLLICGCTVFVYKCICLFIPLGVLRVYRECIFA